MRIATARLRLLLVGLHLIQGAVQVALLFGFVDEHSRRALRRAWSRQLLRLLAIRIETPVQELSQFDRGLLVANHISFVDIFVINALLPSAFVAKSEVAAWPLVGWLCRRNDTLFIERGSRIAAHRTHCRMRDALAGGSRLAIFPEGTTSAGDQVLPFHGALFQSAIDAGAPVHSIALSYHAGDGSRTEAAAYTGNIGVVDCLKHILRAGPLVVRVAPAATFAPPLPVRRDLARHAHRAVERALSAARRADEGDGPTNQAAIPNLAETQPRGNEAAISR